VVGCQDKSAITSMLWPTKRAPGASIASLALTERTLRRSSSPDDVEAMNALHQLIALGCDDDRVTGHEVQDRQTGGRIAVVRGAPSAR
jgi:hypothetical protein